MKTVSARRKLNLVTQKLDEVLRDLGEEPDVGFVTAAGRKILEQTDWHSSKATRSSDWKPSAPQPADPKAAPSQVQR